MERRDGEGGENKGRTQKRGGEEAEKRGERRDLGQGDGQKEAMDTPHPSRRTIHGGLGHSNPNKHCFVLHVMQRGADTGSVPAMY